MPEFVQAAEAAQAAGDERAANFWSQAGNAALASGFGATWLSGWFSHDRDFIRDHFNLTDGETVAGIVHIGTAANTPPDRPRPDINAITYWSAA